jgi:phosphogluconate dehydratase
MTLHPTIADVTARIRERSHITRSAYLQRLDRAATRAVSIERMGCGNVAHAVAAMPLDDRFKVLTQRAPNIGIVTAYNDMLSAHQPLQS